VSYGPGSPTASTGKHKIKFWEKKGDKKLLLTLLSNLSRVKNKTTRTKKTKLWQL